MTCCNNYCNKCSNGVPFHRHKPGDVVSIRQSPHRQLSAVRQTRPHTDAAAVSLSKVSKNLSKWSLSILLLKILSWIYQLKIFKRIQIFKNKKQISLHRPISVISVVWCRWLQYGNKVSWYPVLSKFISNIPEDCRLFVDSLYKKLLILTNICWNYIRKLTTV